jgi:hypothetical protein
MKVFAIHDATGEISEIITAPDGAPAAGLVTPAGSVMTEVQVPAGYKIADPAQGNMQDLAVLAKQYRVHPEPKIGKLVRRPDAAQ